MIVDALKHEMEKRNLSIYKVSKLTGITYELLRRVFSENRKLSADEFILILDKCNITYDEIVKNNVTKM